MIVQLLKGSSFQVLFDNGSGLLIIFRYSGEEYEFNFITEVEFHIIQNISEVERNNSIFIVGIRHTETINCFFIVAIIILRIYFDYDIISRVPGVVVTFNIDN